jgi:hypothetical protein
MNYLFNDERTVFSHAIHNRKCSIFTSSARRLRSDGKRIDESLWVEFANICKETADIPADVGAWRLDARNNLIQTEIEKQTNGDLDT